jgi:DegV family protein with EDD domain
MEAYRRIMDSMNVYMVVDDLKHLQRGGRINPSVAFVGGMLGIKPLLTIKDGIIDSYGKERGKRRAMEKLIDISVENIKKPDETNVWIVHTDALSDAETMKSMFLERIKPKEVLIIELGACIGSHTGRGLVGIVFNAAE